MQQVEQSRRSPARIPNALDSSNDQQFDLTRLVSIFWGGKWWLLLGALLGLLGSFYYLAVVPNKYESDALLQIQSNSASPLSGISDLGAGGGEFGGQSIAQSEIPIIKSRAVIGGAVHDLNLTTTVSRHYLPLVGRIFSSPASIKVKKFDLSGIAPSNAGFDLAVHPGGSYTLFDANGDRVANGQAGKLLTANLANGGTVKLLVSNVDVPSSTSFKISKTPWLAKVHQVQSAVNVTEVGQKSGILSLSITGANKQHITRVLNSVVHNYVQQNIEARSQEASQSLKFLNSQLPKLKKKVNSADQRLADYKEKHQPVELGAQAQALLGEASNLQNKKSELRLKIAQLRQQYTDQYPELAAAQQQYTDLNHQISRLQQRIDKLPSDQKTLLALQRDVKVNTQLYTSLLNRAQSLQVAKAGTIGNVRVIDPAVVPLARVSPKPKVAMVVGVFLGVLLAALGLLARIALRRGVSDPAELETRTALSVFGVIPYSNWMARQLRSRARRAKAPLLARDHPSDVVVEALRSLRTSLQFAQMESASNVVMFTGPAPGGGKSFLSLNLGYLLADAGRNVLVIDADMRRGHLHDVFADKERGVGLSEALSGTATLEQAARPVADSSLHVVTSGQIPPNPAELLLGGGFAELIAVARNSYDLVIVDAPPILAVTDAAIIANAINELITLFVLKSGEHPWKEIDEAIARFERQGGSVSGLVLNSYRSEQERSYYGYGHYQYAYDSKAH